MSSDLNTSRTKFIFEWVKNNLYGWIIFDFILLFVFPLLEPDTRKASFTFGVTVVGLLLGASVGITQWLWLKTKIWTINAFWWIFVTSLGWGFSAFLFSIWPSLTHMHSFSTETCSLLLGIIIGTLQAFVRRKSIRKSILWIVINAFGMLALVWSVYGVLLGPIVFQTTLLNIFHSLFMLIPAKVFYFPYVWIILPFVGAIPTALPTGFLLYSEYNSRNASMPDQTNVEIQAKAG